MVSHIRARGSLVAVAGAILLVAACSSHGQPRSSATPTASYVAAVRPFDALPDSDHDLLNLGYTFCGDLQRLGTPEQLVPGDYQSVIDSVDSVVPRPMATAEVVAAIMYLCPEYKRILPAD